VSRPKFQSRDARESAELGLEPLGSPWDLQRIRERMEKVRAEMPAITRPYFDVDTAVRRSQGRRRHQAYLRRTGGNLRSEIEEVPLLWDCCGRQELLDEVHYDRNGNLRPEDVAIVRALAYYHRCDG
jgi:hypothetical protein